MKDTYDAIEAQIFGRLLQDNRKLFEISHLLTTEDFGSQYHRDLWQAALDRIQSGKPFDPVSLKGWSEQWCRDSGNDPVQFGFSYLVQLLDAASGVKLSDAANVLRTHAFRRRATELARTITERVNIHELDDTEETLAGEIEAALATLTNRAAGDFQHAIGTGHDARMEMWELIGKGQAPRRGISSGLSDLDVLTGGFQPGGLYILAARPSMGKSTLALNFAHHAAREGKRLFMPSLEMTRGELAAKVIAEITGISTIRQSHGPLTPQEIDELSAASESIEKLPIVIDDRAGQSITGISLGARRVANRGGLDMIIVDHLSIMRGRDGVRYGTNRVQEISDITGGLKTLAKDLNVPVIALSQLNRQLESRDDKRPTLSDLRDSGSIEQDADVVMFTYRDEYYIEREEPLQGTPEHLQWQDKLAAVKGLAELNVAKNRLGRCGRANLVFDGVRSKFFAKARD